MRRSGEVQGRVSRSEIYGRRAVLLFSALLCSAAGKSEKCSGQTNREREKSV